MRYLFLTCLAIFAAMAGTASPVRADGAVQIIKPGPGSYVSGPTAIEVSLQVPEGVNLTRLEFHVDGQVIAALVAPPWRVVHNFGDKFEAWFIQVKAYSKDDLLGVQFGV